ncbi:MAG: dihydroneopterin aldolase [Pseudomonadota bacterium]
MTDIVYIRGLQIDAIIGIHPWERDTRQPIVLDIDMAVDTRPGAATDEISDALDYAAVAERVETLVHGSQYQLVESLAEMLAEVIRVEFSVSWLRLRIAKPAALENAQDVGVVIERGERP